MKKWTGENLTCAFVLIQKKGEEGSCRTLAPEDLAPVEVLWEILFLPWCP